MALGNWGRASLVVLSCSLMHGPCAAATSPPGQSVVGRGPDWIQVSIAPEEVGQRAAEAPNDSIQAVQFDTATLEGRASVIDGDTIEIHGQRVRLHGIDAPESGQTCEAEGQVYRCGQKAALALDQLAGGRSVECRQTDIDRYGRIVAVCWTDGAELNARMVETGWALAFRRYSSDYVDEESQAASRGIGLWAGSFVPPWDFRNGLGQDLGAEPTKQASAECPIKGNISRSGERIYHLPGGENYGRTKIDESRGERWFCTEEEALAAGWRRSKR